MFQLTEMLPTSYWSSDYFKYCRQIFPKHELSSLQIQSSVYFASTVSNFTVVEQISYPKYCLRKFVNGALVCLCDCALYVYVCVCVRVRCLANNCHGLICCLHVNLCPAAISTTKGCIRSFVRWCVCACVCLPPSLPCVFQCIPSQCVTVCSKHDFYSLSHPYVGGCRGRLENNVKQAVLFCEPIRCERLLCVNR